MFTKNIQKLAYAGQLRETGNSFPPMVLRINKKRYYEFQ